MGVMRSRVMVGVGKGSTDGSWGFTLFFASNEGLHEGGMYELYWPRWVGEVLGLDWVQCTQKMKIKGTQADLNCEKSNTIHTQLYATQPLLDGK